MQLSSLLVLTILHSAPVGGIERGGPCSSADIDAAARQLLQHMVSSVTARLQSSESPEASPKTSQLVDGVDPVENWADTLREMHSKLAAAGFDFQSQPHQKLANNAVSTNNEARTANNLHRATSSQKDSEFLPAKVDTLPTATSVSNDDIAIAEAHTVDGVKRAMREEWAKAIPFFLRATEANPFEVPAF